VLPLQEASSSSKSRLTVTEGESSRYSALDEADKWRISLAGLYGGRKLSADTVESLAVAGGCGTTALSSVRRRPAASRPRSTSAEAAMAGQDE